MVTNSPEIQKLVDEGVLPQITEENYYTPEINKAYMSFHTWVSLHGCDGIVPCEARTMAELNGEYEDAEADNKALLIGSYVDAKLAGDENEFAKFVSENPSIFTYEKTPNLEKITIEHPEWLTKNGTLKSEFSMKKLEEKGDYVINTPKGLKSEFVMAEKMVARCKECETFMWYMSGEKQRIFTGMIEGIPFKCKLDSYAPSGEPIIVDLKTTKDIHKMGFVPDIGHIDFCTEYGYQFQLAIYREIVRQNTGESCDCYICAVSKNKHPERKILAFDDLELYEAITEVKRSLNGSLPMVWRGEIEPVRCERPSCPYCLDTEDKTEVINHKDLVITF